MSFKRVYTKRLTAFLLLFALIFSQISISSHAAIHPDHSYSVGSYDTKYSHDDKHHSKHKCPECFLTKAFQNALAADSSFDFGALLYLQAYAFAQKDVAETFVTANYQPRAPPTFLI